jgi:hypothetical protein
MAEPFVKLTFQGNLNITADTIMSIVEGEARKALNDSLREGKKAMRQEIINSNAVAHKTTLNSVSSKIDSLSTKNWVYQGDIYFKGLSELRVSFADTGRGPGKFDEKHGKRSKITSSDFYLAILAWTGKKGLDKRSVYPIMRSLTRHGTNHNGAWAKHKRKPFLADGTIAIEKIFKEHFDEAAERIARKMQNAFNSASAKKN